MKWENDTWLTIIFTLLAAGASLAVNILEGRFGMRNTIIILITVIGVVLFSAWLGSVLASRVGKEVLESQIDIEIDKIQKKDAACKVMDGILQERKLVSMEEMQKIEEIWLVLSDMTSETTSGQYSNAVRKNLKKGTKYRYFILGTSTNKLCVDILKNECGNGNLEIYYVPEDFFCYLPGVDFTIYEPLAAEKGRKKGYMGLPICETSDEFAIQMDEEFVDAVVDRMAGCINKLQVTT